MNIQDTKAAEKQLYYRLISLWVICEAFAGGIMHGLKIPFTGMIISSLAISCIILIANHSTFRFSILRATLIVAIFKMMLSPHSPPTAYIAVFFQGLMGELLLKNKKNMQFASIILAVLSLVESAIQRILVLVIVYGNKFWNAVNEFIVKLTGDKSNNNYSLTIAVIYVGIHAFIGIFVGIYAYRLAKKSSEWKKLHPELIITETAPEKSLQAPQKSVPKKGIKWIFIICWLLLLAAYIHAWQYPEQSFIPKSAIADIMIRSVLIVAGWLLLLSPVLTLLIRKFLSTQQKKRNEIISEISRLLPQTRFVFARSWQMASAENGFEKIKLFTKTLLINIL